MSSTVIYQEVTTKHCNKCNSHKHFTEFYKDKRASDGLYSHCKSCHAKLSKKWTDSNKDRHAIAMRKWQENNKGAVCAISAKRKASKLQATPQWFEREGIAALYDQCKQISEQTGIEHHVDHIVPLQSDVVCGLHCLANLRIIPAMDNYSKNNRHWPNMP